MITEEYLEGLLQQRIDMGLKGRQSSKSHLKSALYDWRVEQQWSKDSSKVITYEDKRASIDETERYSDELKALLKRQRETGSMFSY